MVIGLILIAAVLCLSTVCVLRSFLARSLQVQAEPLPPSAFDAQEQASILAKALTFKTIAKMYPEPFDTDPFSKLHEQLRASFPLCHTKLKLEKPGGLNLLFTWEGSKPEMPGILLMAHQDVVPVEPGTEGDWVHEPFSGVIADGFVWGRGALDIKNQLTGILAAVEQLLNTGFKPVRTVYLSFGCDEEVQGIGGTRLIEEHLRGKGVRLAYVLDEGGAVVKGMVPGVHQPVGLIGIAEKGYLTLTLETTGEGGHSSMPPQHTSLGKAAQALVRLESRPFKPAIKGAVKHFLRFLAPELPFLQRLALVNTWLFKPAIIALLASSKATNALIRTTQAATMTHASTKENVLPQRSSIQVNFRILPGETTASVKRHVEQAVRGTGAVVVDPPYALEPSKVSDPFSPSFRQLQRTVSACFPEAIAVPYLVLGGTDSRYFEAISEKIFRFSPVVLDEAELGTMHGTNERISIEAYSMLIRFYYTLISKTSCMEEL